MKLLSGEAMSELYETARFVVSEDGDQAWKQAMKWGECFVDEAISLVKGKRIEWQEIVSNEASSSLYCLSLSPAALGVGTNPACANGSKIV